MKKSLAISLLTIVVLSALGIYSFSRAQEQDVYITFGVDKTEIVAGERLTYTLYVKNNSAGDLTNVNAATTLDKRVDYVPNSGVFKKGDKEFQIPDSWVTDRLNMGTIIPGQENSIVYQVDVRSTVQEGRKIKGVGQIEPEGMAAQAYRAVSTVVSASQTAKFRLGDTFQGVNNTRNESNWRDQVAAEMGNVIQFKFRIVNDGDYESRNTAVRVQIPWDPKKPSNTLVSHASVTADNADPMTDSMTVNLSGTSSYLWPRDGHYFINGTTDLYNCPNGCPVPNQFLWQPLPIGRIQPGASVEVLFKADIVNIEQPTPTPTPTPSSSPTPTPTPTPQVLGAQAPEKLPETGATLLAVPVIFGVGFYLYKRFRLI